VSSGAFPSFVTGEKLICSSHSFSRNKSFAGINVFGGKGNIRARVVWPDGQPDDAIKEEIMGFGVSTFRARGTRGDYGYGQMETWEILRAT
jgi:hypothetical protein